MPNACHACVCDVLLVGQSASRSVRVWKSTGGMGDASEVTRPITDEYTPNGFDSLHQVSQRTAPFLKSVNEQFLPSVGLLLSDRWASTESRGPSIQKLHRKVSSACQRGYRPSKMLPNHVGRGGSGNAHVWTVRRRSAESGMKGCAPTPASRMSKRGTLVLCHCSIGISQQAASLSTPLRPTHCGAFEKTKYLCRDAQRKGSEESSDLHRDQQSPRSRATICLRATTCLAPLMFG